MKAGKEERKIQQNKVKSDVYLREQLRRIFPQMSGEACEQMILELKSEPKKNKKRFLKIFYSRILFTSIIFMLQFVWFLIILTHLSRYSQIITVGFRVFSVLMALFLINKQENSVYKISWILLILTFPVLGGLLYLLFGNKHPAKGIQRKVDRQQDRLMRELPDAEVIFQKMGREHGFAGIARCLYHHAGYPVYRGTDTTYYALGEEMFKDMICDLQRAKHYIFLEYFIISEGLMWNRVFEILKEKAKEGLDVRLIYDDVGCLGTLSPHFRRELERSKIACIVFNPFRPVLSLAVNNRDHRKIVVIDGTIAYTGGVNLADEYINVIEKYGHWKDTAVRLSGEAALSFTEMFLEMWDAFSGQEDRLQDYLPIKAPQKETAGEGFVQPFGDSPLDEKPTGEDLYLNILNQAQDYVYMCTPYLIISDEMQRALVLAAGRGVDVRLMTPGVPDKAVIFRITRSNYRTLLKGGVRIFEYEPGFVHAKNFVSDDKIAVVGTVNMDFRSLYLHFECGAVLYQNQSVLDIRSDFLKTLGSCREVHVWDRKDSLFSRLVDAVLRLFSPLV